MNKDNLLSELWRIAQKEDEELFFKYAAGDVLDEYTKPLWVIQYEVTELARMVEDLEDQLEESELKNDTLRFEKEQLESDLHNLESMYLCSVKS